MKLLTLLLILLLPSCATVDTTYHNGPIKAHTRTRILWKGDISQAQKQMTFRRKLIHPDGTIEYTTITFAEDADAESEGVKVVAGMVQVD